MQRKLDLIILGHLWVLAPLALAWFAIPAWRGGEDAPHIVRELGILTAIATGYLVVRSYLVLTSRAPYLHDLWQFVDVALITSVLVMVRNPADALFALYFVPLASAVAVGSIGHAVGIGAAAVAGYLLVILQAAAPWTIRMFFRLMIIALMASLYGWIVRTDMTINRAREGRLAWHRSAGYLRSRDSIQTGDIHGNAAGPL